MKTDDLISLLATGTVAVKPHAAERRYALAIGGGAILALALMLTLMDLRPDLVDAVWQPMFWLKIGFVLSLMGVSLFAALRLSRPGARLSGVAGALAGPVALMWGMATVVLIQADPAQRSGLFFGETWRVCPALIALISLPVFALVMWAMKGLAPTRPRYAGFAAGLLSGATATLVYSLHCPEMGVPFIAFWYLLGMLIPAGVGALTGRWLLRW